MFIRSAPQWCLWMKVFECRGASWTYLGWSDRSLRDTCLWSQFVKQGHHPSIWVLWGKASYEDFMCIIKPVKYQCQQKYSHNRHSTSSTLVWRGKNVWRFRENRPLLKLRGLVAGRTSSLCCRNGGGKTEKTCNINSTQRKQQDTTHATLTTQHTQQYTTVQNSTTLLFMLLTLQFCHNGRLENPNNTPSLPYQWGRVNKIHV